MITKDQKELAQWAMETALKNGCQACKVTMNTGSQSSYEVRDTKLDNLLQSEESQLSIQLYVDGRYGRISTNRIYKNELEKFIKEGIVSVRFLAEDKARTLPNPKLFFKGSEAFLNLFDEKFDTINPDEKLKLAHQSAAEIYGTHEMLNSVSSKYSDGTNFTYIITSNGFENERAKSYYGLSVSASVKGSGDARPQGDWSEHSMYWNELKKTDIGHIALKRALRKLGSKKIASGIYTMLVDNIEVANLLSPLISAIDGSSIQQKDSFLLDKIDERVISDKITLIDNPIQPKTIGAKCFDNEGIALKKRTLFDKGVLKTYLIDTYIANKMNWEANSADISILQFELGNRNKEEIISKLDKAIFVTGFNGGNSNSSTGDFSYGIEGFLIEKGEIKQPISEMNITGNILTLWSNLIEVGNDPRLSSSWQMPSLLFNNVDFSGL
jgi:PmbA protein